MKCAEVIILLSFNILYNKAVTGFKTISNKLVWIKQFCPNAVSLKT